MIENAVARMLQNGTEVNGYESRFSTDILKGGCDEDPEQDQEPVYDIKKIRRKIFFDNSLRRANSLMQRL